MKKEIIEFGVLFKHKVLNSYYDLYSGYLSKLQAEALDLYTTIQVKI